MPIIGDNSIPHVPGELGLPFFGTAFSFLKDANALILDHQKKYGNIFKSRFFGFDTVYLLGPDANKFLLVEQAKYTSSQEAWERIIAELFPNGLMLMDGDRHKKHRSILNEAFKKEPMQGYLELIKPTIEKDISDWPENVTFQFYLKTKALALQIAGLAFFGLDFDSDLSTINRDIIDVLKASLAIPINLPFTKYGKGIRARQRLELYFKSMIDKKRSEPTPDLFSMLCHSSNEDGQILEDQEIIDHLIFILMAGHDTAATTLSSMAYLLGKNPNWQSKARAEAVGFLQNNPDYNLKSLSELKVIGSIIKETLRLYPPVTMIGRISQVPLKIGGYDFPAKTSFSVVFQHSHNHTDQWTDASQFNPARFEKPMMEHRKCPHAYAPFGAGPHHCIGYAFAEMELKMSILTMLTQFKWSIPENYIMEMNQVPIQEPKDNLPILLKKI